VLPGSLRYVRLGDAMCIGLGMDVWALVEQKGPKKYGRALEGVFLQFPYQI